MKKIIYSGVLTLMLTSAFLLVPSARAEVTNTASQLEQITALLAQLQELQKQLSVLQGQVQEVLKAGIVEGTSDDDVKKIQELLSTDPAIYPEGKVTGFFGPLTREALKRFQVRHELEVTGVLDENTRKLMEEYLAERSSGKIPPGLLRAPGVGEKIEMRFREKCDNSGSGKDPFCERLKIKFKMKDGKTELEVEDEDEDEDHEHEDEDDDEDEDDEDDEDEHEDEDEDDDEDEDEDEDN